MNLRKTFPMLAFGVCVAAGAVLLAQQAQPRPAQPRQPAQPGQIQPQAASGQAGQAAQRPVWMTTDQHVASCLAISNHLEVAVAEFAHERADDKEVQEFAKMLIDDHRAFLKKLERWAPQAARDDFLKEEDEQATDRRDQPGTGIQQTAGTRTNANAGSHPVNILQLDREIAQECLNTSKQLLSEKEGDEFNHCFVGTQFLMHNVMQDKLTVFQRHVSDDLGQVLSDASETVDEHMTRAKEMMKKWDSSSGRVAKEERDSERK
jgi:predicted outer membrane protein